MRGNQSRRRFAAAVLAGGALAGGIVVSTGASATSRRPQLAEQRILHIAERAAAQARDPSPVLIQHSAGTRDRANLVDSGEIVPGRQWSYLIAERGHFVFENATRPAGAPAPRGTVLTLIVNASTGEVTDVGLSNRYPHLSRLGPVHTDLRRVAMATRQVAMATEASCVGFTPSQERAVAKVILVGRMLPGPSTVVAGHQVLLSPARMRVVSYLKGSGPRLASVQTGARRLDGRVWIAEDGIMPAAGQRWKIFSSTRRPLFATSTCLGSRQLLIPTRSQIAGG